MGIGPYIFLGGLLFFTAYVWLHLLLAWTQNYTADVSRVVPAVILGGAMLLLIWMPFVLGRLMGLSGRMSLLITIFSSTWMMMELWFGFAALCCDGVNLCLWLWRHFHTPHVAGHLLFSWRAIAVIGGIYAVVSAVVGFIQAGHPVVHHTVVKDSRVPVEADGYRIMLCSDIHLVEIYRKSILGCIEEAQRKWKPQLFLHAGDFIDGPNSGDVSKLTARIAEWSFPDGKFASFGNHDGYADWSISRDWHAKAGLTLLGNRVGRPDCQVTPWLHLGAVDDQAVWMKNYNKHTPAEAQRPVILTCEAIPAPREDSFNLLLRHRPELNPDHFDGWQLMLSGHTHGGQIFPFSLSIPFTCQYATSRLYRIDTGMRLYICQGTGFWGPPFRSLVPPEIAIIELRHAPEGEDAKP